MVLHITRHAQDDWTAMVFSIDRSPDGFGVNDFSFHPPDLKFSIDALHIRYTGKLSVDGSTIAGTWTDGMPLPLDFHRATEQNAWRDTAQDKIFFVHVNGGVRLEVIDWGGTGRPLVLLAGLGNTAHIFDKFALKLTPNYHVYGITRRGFGESSVPPATDENYSADRLGDDVLAVIDVLQLKRPVLAGHSIAGEELSSIGSRHPEKVSGLIYLDAGFSQSFYITSLGDPQIDSNEVVQELEQLSAHGTAPQDRKRLVEELLKTSLPQLQKDLVGQEKQLEAVPDPPSGTSIPPRLQGPWSAAAQAILQGEQKYTRIMCPVLLLAAVPHATGPAGPGDDPVALAAAQAKDLAETTAHANAFEAGVPKARVVRLPNASHFIFLSNEADVLREMNAFLATLP
jgi:pimeloyl-ACP methyl ester carboxylesterase